METRGRVELQELGMEEMDGWLIMEVDTPQMEEKMNVYALREVFPFECKCLRLVAVCVVDSFQGQVESICWKCTSFWLAGLCCYNESESVTTY